MTAKLSNEDFVARYEQLRTSFESMLVEDTNRFTSFAVSHRLRIGNMMLAGLRATAPEQWYLVHSEPRRHSYSVTTTTPEQLADAVHDAYCGASKVEELRQESDAVVTELLATGTWACDEGWMTLCRTPLALIEELHALHVRCRQDLDHEDGERVRALERAKKAEEKLRVMRRAWKLLTEGDDE